MGRILCDTGVGSLFLFFFFPSSYFAWLIDGRYSLRFGLDRRRLASHVPEIKRRGAEGLYRRKKQGLEVGSVGFYSWS